MKDSIGDCSKNKDIINAFLVPKKLGKYNNDDASCLPGRGVVYSFLVSSQTEYRVLLISIFDTENKENN